MYKNTNQSTRAFRFRRFCRAGWAAYSSMHREVTIGRLAVHVANHSFAKGTVVIALAFTLSQGSLMAQSDDDRETRTLPEVTVTLTTDTLGSTAEPAAVITAADFQQSTIHSIGDLVAQLPGVDLRVRGGGDVQGDLSMRGGTFDQMLVMLNGINFTDAQTGHHTLDIPIDITMVERIELLTPAQCMARGIVAFCGAVNIVVCEQYRNRLLADISGGSHGTVNASLLGTKAVDRWTLTAATSFHRSDGYMRNTDYQHGSLLLQALRHGERSDWHMQLGGQMKDFGGAGFYSTTYPDQYESTRTLVASVSNDLKISNFKIHFMAYGRLHSDRFELFRDGFVDSVPTWYSGHNHHVSSLAGAKMRLVKPLGIGNLMAGGEVRREGIWSNVLGIPDSTLPHPYTHCANRTSANIFGGYSISYRKFSTEAVALALYNSHFGSNFALSANLHFSHFNLQFARTFRLPTFTDLYYQGANQTANPNLDPESSTNIELASSFGGRTFKFRTSVYYRAGQDIIDWVRRPSAEMWYSMNHTAVDALGFDIQTRLQLSVFKLQTTYSFCHINQDAGEWISGSALDYLRHQFRTTLTIDLSPCTFSLSSSYRFREGNYVLADGNTESYGGVLLAEVRASYTLGHATLYLEGHNLLNTSWRDHGGVPQPGLTLLAGVRFTVE